MPVNGVLPVVSVYDANANPVSSEILLNGNGTLRRPGHRPDARGDLLPPGLGRPGSRTRRRQFLTGSQLRPGARRRANVRRRHAVGIRHSRINTPCMSPKANCSSSSCPPARTQSSTNTQVSMQIYDSTGAVVFSLIGRARRDRQRRQHPSDAGRVPGEHLRRQLQRDGGALDRLSGERGQSLGPHRPGLVGPDRGAHVSVPGRPRGRLLLLPRWDLFHHPLRILVNDVIGGVRGDRRPQNRQRSRSLQLLARSFVLAAWPIWRSSNATTRHRSIRSPGSRWPIAAETTRWAFGGTCRTCVRAGSTAGQGRDNRQLGALEASARAGIPPLRNVARLTPGK